MADLLLGQKIQRLRMERGLSVRKLSMLGGITPSMLSQIENEQVNPSVNTLRAIARALDIPMYAMFIDERETNPVVHPNERRIIGTKSEPGVRYELLTCDAKGDIEFCIMVIPPHSSSYRDSQSHKGEEVVYILEGDGVELDMDGVEYNMQTGDSVRIAPNVPHVWHNRTDSTVKAIFAITPPTF